MPTFRTAPSTSLTASIRRMVASGGGKLSPLQEMQADAMAAQTAQHLGLAEKARAEAEAMRNSQADRANPAVATEYAGNVAGIDAPTATRLSNHLRGVLEQPSVADMDDAAIVGAEAKPFVTGAPNLEPGTQRLFQSALASTIANRLATGKTNAHQLALSGEHINKTALINDAANAETVPEANRIVSAVAGRLREPFKTNAQGTVLNEETGDLDESSDLAGAVRNVRGAQAAAARASAVQRTGGAPAAAGDTPTAALPGGTGTSMMQETESGTKYAVNQKTGRAWKATEQGWEPVLVTNLPKNLQKFGTGGATQGNREAVFTQRVIQSGNQAAHDLHNIVQLPMTASTGVFGGRKQGPGLFDATKEVLANKMTGQEVQSYNVMATGFQRSLATIETQGLAPAGSLTHAMDAVLFKEGDTNLTKLHKLGQIRQIVTSGMEVMLDNPRVSEMEKGRIKKVLERVNAAVPFTHEDLINLEKAQQLDPNATLASVVKKLPKAAAAGGPAATNAKGWVLHKDAAGNQAYVSPDGKEFEEVK
jgi:hypothetical protein